MRQKLYDTRPGDSRPIIIYSILSVISPNGKREAAGEQSVGRKDNVRERVSRERIARKRRTETAVDDWTGLDRSFREKRERE